MLFLGSVPIYLCVIIAPPLGFRVKKRVEIGGHLLRMSGYSTLVEEVSSKNIHFKLKKLSTSSLSALN